MGTTCARCGVGIWQSQNGGFWLSDATTSYYCYDVGHDDADESDLHQPVESHWPGHMPTAEGLEILRAFPDRSAGRQCEACGMVGSHHTSAHADYLAAARAQQ